MAEPLGLVNRILAPSFLDGPGARLAVFLQGCDLACGYCHNPETWNACSACGQCLPGCPGDALVLVEGRLRHDPSRCLACDRCLEACASHASPRAMTMTVDQLLARARPWAPFLDGVTFSGGECTLQWPFLLACLPRLAELGLPTLLDSNGNMAEEVLEALLPACAGLLFDLKALDPDRHLALTGAGNGRILANLARAAAAGKVTEVRAVLLPGISDDEASVRELAELVLGLGGQVPLRLSPYRPQGVRGSWAQVPALAPEAFARLCRAASAVLGPRLIHAYP